MFYEWVYDIAPGKFVEVELDKAVFDGMVRSVISSSGKRNPEVDKVKLRKLIDIPGGKKAFVSFHFPVNKIVSLSIANVGRIENPKYFKKPSSSPAPPPIPTEYLLPTYVIRTEGKFKLLLKLLEQVKICGMTIEGQDGIGRLWIILFIRDTLVPLDVVSLSARIPDFWDVLQKGILQNKGLVKVVHGFRKISNFLNKVHGIEMKNVLDLQVLDALLYFKIVGSPPMKMLGLADLLQKYDQKGKILPQEIAFVRKFTEKDPSPVEFFKLCAIKAKYLIYLLEQFRRITAKK